MDVKRKKCAPILECILLIGLLTCFICLPVLYLGKTLPAMKCNDPQINEPMINDGVNYWSKYLILGFGLLLFLFKIIIMGLNSIVAGHWYYGFVRPFLIVLIGIFGTYALVKIMSKHLAVTAPNFIAACEPQDLTLICNETASHLVRVNCTTPQNLWIPASSAFPSMISTIQSFVMCLMVLYRGYGSIALNSRKEYFKFSLIALCFIIGTCYETVRVNEATVTAVVVGCVIGISCAVMTFFLLSLLEWIKKKDTHQLPRFYDDVLTNESQMSVPSPSPLGDAALPPKRTNNPSTPVNPPILPSPID